MITHASGIGPAQEASFWYGSGYDRDEILRRIRYLQPNSRPMLAHPSAR